MELMQMAFALDSLSVYKNIRQDPVVQNFYDCVLRLYTNHNVHEQLQAVFCYTQMCHILYESEYEGNLADYMFDRVIYDTNVFSMACAKKKQQMLDINILRAVAADLRVLCNLSALSDSVVKSAFKSKFLNSAALIDALPSYSISHKRYSAQGDWSERIDSIAEFYAQNGVGMYAKYHGFVFDQTIVPVSHPDPISLGQLKRYEIQKQKVVENTRAFLEGRPSSNVLLYGDRGTGKSSMVKALLNEFGRQGLRIVELNKRALTHLDALLAKLEEIPLKFIVFIDDLTINENDESFNILKAALEGSLNVRSDHVAVYATSNRRHLVKESFSAREGDEVHRADTIDETISLSDRFGLVVTFTKPGKEGFLEIVKQLASDCDLQLPEDQLFADAEKFALTRGGRSPRLAKQFVDSLCAQEDLQS